MADEEKVASRSSSQNPRTTSPQPAESIEVDHDGEREKQDRPALSPEQVRAFKNIVEIVITHKITIKGEEYYPSQYFRRVVNKRNMPEYYEVIKDPVALSTIKSKFLAKSYRSVQEIVRDFALITHNAQIYNRPNSGVYKDALVLKSLVESELQKLVNDGIITAEEATSPDLGEIPYATPEPDPVDEDEEDDEDDEEEDDEADDTDEEKGRRARRRGPRSSVAASKRNRSQDDGDQKKDDGDRKRRGRPPRVDTPMEARIKAILKGIRKFKHPKGYLKVVNFEKLPDKITESQYYTVIREPIALDLIKRKAKRKKYQSVEHFMKDMDLMFENAKMYNEDDSEIYKDAVELQVEAHNLAEAEKAKPDSEYLMDEGRMPLPDGILHNGELYKVGDWVHIQNPNDVTKPIVAQIYRTWQDTEGLKWVNACWYYRPEQTVHRSEKHFYPNEVVKTGQYRDHHIDEVVDRCFVMFFTRYSRGRPRGLDPSKEVYVCEARYNEEKHKLNKIKTWASCLPDEVRDKDYEMDLFDVPKKIKKLPSPIKHLLKDDAKETDDLPAPQWGAPNAPPIVGAVHRRPRDENDSPPPEPTPPPPPTPPTAPARQSSASVPASIRRPSLDQQGDVNMTNNTAVPPRPGPSPHQPNQAQQQPSYNSQTPANSSTPSFPRRDSSFTYNPSTPSTQHLQPPSTANAAHSTPSNTTAATATNTTNQPSYRAPLTQPVHPTTGASTSATPPTTGGYPTPNAARPHETFILPDVANASIPASIRSQFQQDEHGRVLFFTAPPMDIVAAAKKGAPPGHTIKYLAAKAESERDSNGGGNDDAANVGGEEEEDEEKSAAMKERRQEQFLKRARLAEERAGARERENTHNPKWKEMNGDGDAEAPPPPTFTSVSQKALRSLIDQLSRGTDGFYASTYGARAEEVKKRDREAMVGRVSGWERGEEERREKLRRLGAWEGDGYGKEGGGILAWLGGGGGGQWQGPGPGVVFKDDEDARY